MGAASFFDLREAARPSAPYETTEFWGGRGGVLSQGRGTFWGTLGTIVWKNGGEGPIKKTGLFPKEPRTVYKKSLASLDGPDPVTAYMITVAILAQGKPSG